MRSSILIPAAIALAAIWGGVALVMQVTDPYIMTPEKVAALVQEPPWKGGKKPSKDVRKAYLEKVAASVNKLDFDQQRRLREDGQKETENFFLDLTEEERKWFLAQTVEKQFLAVMKTFKAMNLDDRRKMINASRQDMRKNGRGVEALDELVQADERAFEIMAEQGLEDYYNKGGDKRKIQMAPLLGELQRRLQGGRRR